jgi:signal peptidase
MLLSYLIIIYSLGIILGFNKGFGFSLNYVKTLVSTILFILELEFIRHMIAKNSLNSKRPIIIFTILSIILNVVLEININNLMTSEDKFIFLSTIIFPVIAEESLCSYLTYKISLFPSLIYKFVTKLYIFIIPIVPDLGNYIYSFVNVLFPYLIYVVINKVLVKYEKIKSNLKKVNLTILSMPLVLLFILLVILVSGLFKYKMIAIGSNSMKPIYSRGDAIIYEKINSEKINVGDILVFQDGKKIVTHRVVKKYYTNNMYYFSTKGDNNDTKDPNDVSSSYVLGRVIFKTKYIGYPTVLINEFFERSK